MAHYRFLFRMPANPPEPPPKDPADMPAYIAKHGERIGELSFGSAEAALFFDAIDTALGLPASDLNLGPLYNVWPRDASAGFGGLKREHAEQLSSEIRSRIEVPGNDVELRDAANANDLDEDQFISRLGSLVRLLDESLKNGGLPATLWE